jgi:hypothetical protein
MISGFYSQERLRAKDYQLRLPQTHRLDDYYQLREIDFLENGGFHQK